MFQIRRNVFETNSSSTHSITMCMKSDYDLWVKDKVWFIDRHNGMFLSWDDLILYLQSRIDHECLECIKHDHANNNIEVVEDLLADYDVYSYNSWHDKKHPELERFTHEFTTPGGDVVKSFGYFGEDY